jgi:hypothetical protein
VSIRPPSDIVLDVANAADPASSAAATERLAKAAGDTSKSDSDFSNVMAEVEQEPPVAMAANAGAPVPIPLAVPAHVTASPLLTQPHFSEASQASAAPGSADAKVYQGFQAVLLQNVLSMMLPESSDFFGEGSAGEIWRSMLAEQLGDSLSKKMDLGIMPRYLRNAQHHETKHDLPMMPAAVPATDPLLIPELSAAMNENLDLTADQS